MRNTNTLEFNRETCGTNYKGKTNKSPFKTQVVSP